LGATAFLFGRNLELTLSVETTTMPHSKWVLVRIRRSVSIVGRSNTFLAAELILQHLTIADSDLRQRIRRFQSACKFSQNTQNR
jgi:hypothetical protein